MLYLQPMEIKPLKSSDPIPSRPATKLVENASMMSRSVVSDERLIQRFQQGDSGSFDPLYERYLPVVYKRVRYVVPEADVEDVTQEVFLAVLKSLSTFRGESLFSTWLRTLTNHKVAEYYRRRNRKQDPPEAPLAEAETLSDGGNAPQLEERIALRNALAAMPPKYREVILLRFSDGMQFDEIARTMGANLETTKSLFRRAVAALRKNLDTKP